MAHRNGITRGSFRPGGPPMLRHSKVDVKVPARLTRAVLSKVEIISADAPPAAHGLQSPFASSWSVLGESVHDASPERGPVDPKRRSAGVHVGVIAVRLEEPSRLAD